MSYKWIFSENDCIVQLKYELFEKMKTYSMKFLPNETGGTLIGYLHNKNKAAIITDILTVKKGGKSSKTSFYRPPDLVDKQLNKICTKTKGKIYYLGEWHSHPFSAPEPSRLDLTSVKELGDSKKVSMDTPILMIIGNNYKSENDINCYMYFEGKHIKGVLSE